jgi:hypothetical protein
MGTKCTVSSENCPRFSCATRSSLLMPRDQFPRFRRSRRSLSECSALKCPDLWLQCRVSFVHGIQKTQHTSNVFFKPCTKLRLYCNHRSGHLKTEHTKPSPAVTLSWKLVPRSRSKHEKWTAGSAWETWTVSVADSVCCIRVGWEITFLITFEVAPFFCVRRVLWYGIWNRIAL